jgi:hypothetical protein
LTPVVASSQDTGGFVLADQARPWKKGADLEHGSVRLGEILFTGE